MQQAALDVAYHKARVRLMVHCSPIAYFYAPKMQQVKAVLGR